MPPGSCNGAKLQKAAESFVEPGGLPVAAENKPSRSIKVWEIVAMTKSGKRMLGGIQKVIASRSAEGLPTNFSASHMVNMMGSAMPIMFRRRYPCRPLP